MRIVLCAVPTDQATRIARSVVEERLAACVQASGVRSTYRWKGRLEQADEVQLWCKVAERSVDALVQRLAELHPYDVPEILVLDVDAARSHPGYVAWVDAAANEPSDAEGGP